MENVRKETIIKKADYLSCNFFEDWTDQKVPTTLRQQYLVNEDGFEELLLSPRSTRKQKGDGPTTFTCCSTCTHNLRNNKVYKPPQFGITNGFLIGYVPKEVVDET